MADDTGSSSRGESWNRMCADPGYLSNQSEGTGFRVPPRWNRGGPGM